MIRFILGGARSGKSRHGEQLALLSPYPVSVVATAQIWDDEMRERITRHQQTRPANWQTLEVPHNLGDGIMKYSQENTCLLVDCLTLWVTNELLRYDIEKENDQLTAHWQQQKQQFLLALKQAPGDIILVSNEVGTGIVPMGAINRRFVDETGWLHQAIAEIADEVYWVVAGLSQRIK
ncbi:bifunctional adenosylcobinamide kinase/adenosylcobinamide-phosphate guanylyltransferase [Motilimonas sp. E26]|uniref:bifunctional adenosylcobinamide kinase/adenosylcobinamide-phosphate guanylyltransferase n=1 Tax=Motilimonas sp. E26 TaxID=2865674 RepID=UPI001E65C5B3|nr:bifunctional adenosylcobinamide kinase/adenosylcobinamide-phosphate guanylyltransferase [Motilimonas sp. E26]MCE0558283.1 bifunctional adenosylcobinamide kinase/adenosylcobinamide-phosphate guanylyltransferase [Motilimonas sp. E26]